MSTTASGSTPLHRSLKFGLPLLLMSFAPLALAEEATLDTGVTAWMMTATVLVLCMCLPGLALFYGGLVRAKNMLSLFSQCFAIAGVIGVLWVLYGYSLVIDTTGMAAGEYSFNSFVGGLEKVTDPAGAPAEVLVAMPPEPVAVLALVAADAGTVLQAAASDAADALQQAGTAAGLLLAGDERRLLGPGE